MKVFSLCDATVKQICSFSGGYTGFRGRFATVCGRYAFSSFFLPAPSPIAATPSPMYPSPFPPQKNCCKEWQIRYEKLRIHSKKLQISQHTLRTNLFPIYLCYIAERRTNHSSEKMIRGSSM